MQCRAQNLGTPMASFFSEWMAPADVEEAHVTWRRCLGKLSVTSLLEGSGKNEDKVHDYFVSVAEKMLESARFCSTENL